MRRDKWLNGRAALILVAGLATCAQAQVIYTWPGTNPWYQAWVPPVAGLRSYSIPTPGPDIYVFGYGAPYVPYSHSYPSYGMPFAYGYPAPYYLAPFPYGYQPVWPYPYVRPYRFHRPRPRTDEGQRGPRDDGNRRTQPPGSPEPMTNLRDELTEPIAGPTIERTLPKAVIQVDPNAGRDKGP